MSDIIKVGNTVAHAGFTWSVTVTAVGRKSFLGIPTYLAEFLDKTIECLIKPKPFNQDEYFKVIIGNLRRVRGRFVESRYKP